MAHSQSAKTPKLNALLIGKRTVPSGCRILNVSQQGMSLQCDPDGRLLTFSNGDSVDIYLSVEHANGQNKFTIPAIVSHVDENSIDVVFHCTDTELTGLIESYRTSEAHNLEASIDHRRISSNESTVKPVVVNDSTGYHEQPGNTARQSSRSFYTGLLILFTGSLVLLGAYYYVTSFNKRLITLETVTRTHTDELAAVQTQVFSSRLQDGRYASLNARMKALTDAFQSFEKRVIQALPQQPLDTAATVSVQVTKPDVTPQQTQAVTSLEAQKPDVDTTSPSQQATVLEALSAEKEAVEETPVEKMPAVIADKQPAEEYDTPPLQEYSSVVSGAVEQTVDEPPQTVSQTETLDEITEEPVKAAPKHMPASKPESQPAASTDTPPTVPAVSVSTPPPVETIPARVAQTTTVHSGPWVINLLSSPYKAYVEKAMAEAQSLGYTAVVMSAKVNGKQYWRLQIPGFDSLATAKKAAEPVKEQMNIEEVWIFNRDRHTQTAPE